MQEVLPILDYIHRSEMANKSSAKAVNLAEPRPSSNPNSSALNAPTGHAVANAGKSDEARPKPAQVTGSSQDQTETSSLSLGLKNVDFQKEKTVCPSAPNVFRTVQALHEPEDGTKRPPICYCGAPRLVDIDVHLREGNTGKRKAGVSGIWRCRNGEVCPMCAEASTARRRDSHARVGGAAIEKGGTIVTVVLSVSHGLQDKLAHLIKAVKKASTGARAGGPWHRKIKTALGALGVLVDHHVRHGNRHGWHYHQHLTIFCLDRDKAAITAAVALLVERYISLLARQGYRASADRQHVKVLKHEPDSGPYTYPADHNRADDDDHIGIQDVDDDEEESLTPLQLAERAAMGDEQAAALFMEFSAAIKKTRSVVVTPAIARALEIERKVKEPNTYNEKNRLGSIPGRVWVKLLDENLGSTFLSRVEAAGRENWPAVRWWSLEQTGEVPDYSIELANDMAELMHAQQRLEDPVAKELAEDQISILRCDWTETHGANLVSATIDYVAANHRHMQVNAADVDYWVDVLDEMAGKIKRRRFHAPSAPLPLDNGPVPSKQTAASQSVPIG